MPKPTTKCSARCTITPTPRVYLGFDALLKPRTTRPYTLEIFQGQPSNSRRSDYWRLRVVAPNGEIILTSEGRTRPSGLRRTIQRFLEAIAAGRLRWTTGVAK